MKIWMVVADNGEPYEGHNRWNVAAFTSEEFAKEHVQKMTDEIRKYKARVDELEDLYDSQGWTESEEKEYRDINDTYGLDLYFLDDGGYFVIEAYEIIK